VQNVRLIQPLPTTPPQAAQCRARRQALAPQLLGDCGKAGRLPGRRQTSETGYRALADQGHGRRPVSPAADFAPRRMLVMARARLGGPASHGGCAALRPGVQKGAESV